jgi:hypothetical protein
LRARGHKVGREVWVRVTYKGNELESTKILPRGLQKQIKG